MAIFHKNVFLNVLSSNFSEKVALTKSLAEVQLELNSLKTKLEESKQVKQEAVLEVYYRALFKRQYRMIIFLISLISHQNHML